MPEFKKGNDWSNKFLSKSPWKKETRWEGPKDSQKPKARMLEKAKPGPGVKMLEKAKPGPGVKMLEKAKPKPKMVEAEKMKEPKLYSKMKEPKLYSKMKSSHLKATIAKDPTIDEDLAKETRLEGSRGKKVTKTKSRDDWEPAWEGADIGKKEWNNMTKKQQGEYTEKYGD